MEQYIDSLRRRACELEKRLHTSLRAKDSTTYQQLQEEYSLLSRALRLASEWEQAQVQLQKARALQKELDEGADQELETMVNEEIQKWSNRLRDTEQLLQSEMLRRDALDAKNCILEIRAGEGGDEATLFAADLYRMYMRFAERKGWKHTLLQAHRTGLGGFREVILELRGKDAYRLIKYEGGVHRVQRIPKTEKSGRIHTSTVTVAVLPEAEEHDMDIRPEDLNIDVFRSRGHGGQSVNTTDSAVRMTHLPTGIVVTCQDEKSQIKNREKALKVLRARLFAKKKEEEEQKRLETRRKQVGSAERAEKIRTYNFPQDRLTDHRLGKSWSRLEDILNGELDDIIHALEKKFLAKRLVTSTSSS